MYAANASGNIKKKLISQHSDSAHARTDHSSYETEWMRSTNVHTKLATSSYCGKRLHSCPATDSRYWLPRSSSWLQAARCIGEAIVKLFDKGSSKS